MHFPLVSSRNKTSSALVKAKLNAKRLYVSTDWSLRQIAETVGYSERAVIDWKQEGNWEAEKAAHISSDYELEISYRSKLAKVDLIVADYLESADVTELNRWINIQNQLLGSVRNVSGKNTLQAELGTIQRVQNFVRDNKYSQEERVTVNSILADYVKERLREMDELSQQTALK